MNIDRKKRELKGQKQEEQEKARKEKDVAWLEFQAIFFLSKEKIMTRNN